MKARSILLGLMAAAPVLSFAANIDRSTLTEVVNSVRIIEPASKKSSAAQVRAEFIAPNVLRTGADSRAEMIAPDQTVTRVGQNTVFSFARESREIELEKGSVLFQSPSGKGGGTIRTPAASAAVLGTTLIVTATKNGGFKVLLVEGKGRVKSGKEVRNLTAGHLVYALPGGKLSGIFEFRLSQQVEASQLISGFKKKLASSDKIQAAIKRQEKDIASGSALDTGLLASGSPTVAYRVDVAQDSLVKQTVVEAVTESRFVTAATTDTTITSPSLDALRVFAPGDADQLEFPGDSRPFLIGNSVDEPVFQRATNATQFVGSNINFDSSSVDLGSYASSDAIRFLALNDVTFNQTVDFGAIPGSLQIWAGGTFKKTQGRAVAVRAAAGNLTLAAFGNSFSADRPLPDNFAALDPSHPITLSGFTAENTVGSLFLIAGQIQLDSARLGADTALLVGATRDVIIRGTANGAAPVPLSGGNNAFPNATVLRGRQVVGIRAGRDIDVARTVVLGPKIRLNGGRDLKLTTVQLDDGSPVLSDRALVGKDFVTGNQTVQVITERLADLTGINFASNDVLIQARTVRLTNVNFRDQSVVILESQNGQLAPGPNTNQPSLPGYVNFIRGVRYGGSPAQNSIVTPGGSSPAPGIVIRARK